MLNVVIRRGSIGSENVVRREVPWRSGVTARCIALAAADILPGLEVEALVNGTMLGEDGYDRELRDGDTVVVVAPTTYGVDLLGYFVYAVISAVVSVGINYAIQALSPTRKAPDQPQDRGDERSATYSWLGIRTNYGQGLLVPVVYGRIATGGQAIETSAFARSQGGSSALAVTTDTLRVVLALSEGPIHRVGDFLATAADRLGGLGQSALVAATQQPIPSENPTPLPNFVRVNDAELATTVEGYQAIKLSWQGGWINSPSGLTAGDRAFLYNPSTSTNYGSVEVVAVQSIGGVLEPLLKEWPTAWEAVAPLGAPNTSNLEIAFGQVNGGTFTSAYARVFQAGSFQFFQKPSAGVQLSIRPGTLSQTPLEFPFSNVSTSYGVNEAIEGFGEERSFTVASAEEVSTVSFVLEAPVGLYSLGPTGENEVFECSLKLNWRFVGETAWRQLQPVTPWSTSDNETFVFAPDFADITSPQVRTVTGRFAAPVSGDLEFRVRRESGAPQNGGSAITWREVTTAIEHQLAYPRIALAAFNLQASSKWSGGLPQFKVRVDGVKVRVWDAVQGFSPRCWDVPAAPFDWHDYPPGRNPAWILLDFLTQPWGLGQYLSEDDLDLPSFAAWAVWCDRDPNPANPWGEPQFTCDLVLDESRPAWEWVLAICEAGRAAPVFQNGKVSIVYEFAAAHAQGSVSVPAKAPSQLFSSSSVQDLTVTWLPRSSRPTAYIFQFLNEEQFWQQDAFPVQDPSSTLDDPGQPDEVADKYRPEQAQLFSVTRPTQVWREGIYRHLVNRLVTRKIDFVTGRWALASQVGDLIEVENNVLRPFGAVVPQACVVVDDVTASAAVIVDHDAAGDPWDAVVFRTDSGAPLHVGIDSMASTTIKGRTFTILTLDEAVTVAAGADAVLGMNDQVVETYRITAIEAREDFTHAITALEWVPEIYDAIDPEEYDEGFSTDFLAVEAQEDGAVGPVVSLIRVVRIRDGHRITFAKPPERRAETARVFARPVGGDAWSSIGATDSNGVDVRGLQAGAQLEISVVLDKLGSDANQPAETGVRALVTVPEFMALTVPPVTDIAENEANGVVTWSWSAVAGAIAYEIRAGEGWAGAPVLARVAGPRVTWSAAPAGGTFLIAAVAEDGRQSNPTAFVPAAAGPDVDFVGTDDDFDGTHTDTVNDEGVLGLDGDALEGAYESDEYDAGFDGPFLWRIAVEGAVESGELVDDVTDLLGSPELDWRTVDGRDASPGRPGVDWSRTVDDVTTIIDDLPDTEFVHGRAGQAGSHTNIVLESRFRTSSGSFGAYTPHEDGVRSSRYAQFRIRVERESTTHNPRIRLARVEARL
jgi:hypothetical protein